LSLSTPFPYTTLFRSWFLRPYFPQIQPLIPVLILHGVVFSSWIILFITQTSLVAAKRTRTHMRLGIAGGVLACLMIIIGAVTARSEEHTSELQSRSDL